MDRPAFLALEDGTVFDGVAVGADGSSVGEVVFNTAITGYQEILTDPSYARQIVTLTYPHIGNTGINDEDAESVRPFAAGLVVRDVPARFSNWRSGRSLTDFLRASGIVGIAGLDTRQLTRILRDKGAQRGCLVAGGDIVPERAIALAQEFPGLKGMDLAREVTVNEEYAWTQGAWQLGEGHRELAEFGYEVVAYDFGIKHNILRLLADRGCRVTVVPATTPAVAVLARRPDGVFLSNGPGDPEPCTYAIEAIRAIVDAGVPVFGICLGHQLLALASGARTVKMKFGHHGANHPVQDLATGKVMITSQNHGFTVDEDSLPVTLRATHRSLFDQSLQGIERTDRPAFSFQGHPEASPGPHDLSPLFDAFIERMKGTSRRT
ncbi:glutamine-hydrolyzing carbamoyl-phosphate synthase small subunit [Methylotetracoccus oryzae]|uniref:glutamine-hydrolyzing carbamoyl-phosphate synthase small subunit n=1 Tax=Methylotetracoccus oryzae TaxID=1919059 RepID=UPI0011187C79|nr:glutamine-hydrolyzing carbamoyl-phosphate synthase small subunit [Methylotetracoccus oryzae]